MKYDEACELYRAVNALELKYKITDDDADFVKIHHILDDVTNRIFTGGKDFVKNPPTADKRPKAPQKIWTEDSEQEDLIALQRILRHFDLWQNILKKAETRLDELELGDADEASL